MSLLWLTAEALSFPLRSVWAVRNWLLLLLQSQCRRLASLRCPLMALWAVLLIAGWRRKWWWRSWRSGLGA